MVHPRTGKILRLRVRLGLGSNRLRSGFSFAEVMFAVVILGVGFILLSAIFPVAAQQQRATNDEAIAAHLADAAIKTILSSTTIDDYPVTPDTDGVMRPFTEVGTLWSKVSGNVINASDPRYAWVPFYSRKTNETTVHISVLVVRRQNSDSYTANDLTGDLQPRGINIMSITSQAGGTGIVQIGRDELGMYQSVTDGSFLIMRSGDVGGRCFQVGHFSTSDSDSVSFTLVAGNGLAYDESFSNDSPSAAVIGRDFTDLANPAAGYSGPSQDVAVYTTITSPN